MISAVAAFSLILGQAFVAVAGTASDPRGRDAGATSDTTIVSDSGRANASTKGGSTSISTRSSAGRAVQNANVLSGSNVSIDLMAAGPYSYNHTTLAGTGPNLPRVSANKTINKTTGVVESLEGGDFKCGDKVVFFAKVTSVGGSGTGTLEMDLSFLAEPTGQPGVGFDDIVDADLEINPGDDAAGGGNVRNNNESVSLSNEHLDTSGAKDAIVGTVTLTGLDAGETIVVRIVGHLGCLPGSHPTGNLQTDILAARLDGTTIPVGNQTIPFKKVEDIAQPGLAVDKTADSGSVQAGQQIGYTITVSNTGNVTITNVSLTDPLPSGPGFDWSLGATGGTDTTGLNCSVTGSPPNESLSCTKSSLAAGKNFTVHVTSPTGDTACGTYDNAASATAAGGLSASSSTVSIVVTGCAPELAISKDTDTNGSVNPGDPFNYLITVENRGNADATGVVISDDLDNTLTVNSATYGGDASGNCTVGAGNTITCPDSGSITLHPGDSVTVTVNVTTADDVCAPLFNTAHVDWTEDQSSDGLDSNLVEVDVTGCAPNLTFSKDGPASVGLGGTVTYTITVHNTGNADSDPVTVTDSVDANLSNVAASFAINGGSSTGCTVLGNDVSCDVGVLAPGDEAIVTITGTAPSDSCPTLSNTAQVNDQDTNTVSTQVAGCAPGLQFSKSGPASVVQGGTVTYHVFVSNTGNADSNPVTVTDNVPLSNVAASYVLNNNGQPVACGVTGSSVSCDLGVLHPGDSVDITITGTAPNDNTCPTLHNTATVSVDETNTNTNTVDTTVTGCSTPPPPPPPGSPALTITKTADAATVLAGSPIGFTITVNSTGSATATGVTLSDPLPSGAGVSWSIAGGSGAGQCSINGSSLSCNFGDMGVGTSKSVHVTSPTTIDSCGRYDNTATVSSTNAGSHSASASVTVQCPAIQVVKSAHPDHGEPGDTITYRYVVTNIGSVDLFDISVDDDVLGHICDIPLLHPGESQTCTKDYVIPDNANISIKNVVVATGHDAEGNEVSDDDTVTIDVVLGKTIAPTPPGGPGGVAFTGSSGIVPLGGLALLLLLVGSGMLWMSRRRGEHATGCTD